MFNFKFFFIFLFVPCLCFTFPDYSIYNLGTKLTDRYSNEVNIQSLSGKVHVISMIYTNCKTICPIIIANMRNIEKMLTPSYKNSIRFTLITLDPDRDDAAKLNKFFLDKKFNDNWSIYKASKEETLKLALSLGIKYKKEKNDEYVHSNLIIVLDKDGIIRLHHQGLDKNFDGIVKLLYSLAN